MATVNELEEAKRIMVEYLKLKVKQEDWHGTADAAMDIREIDAKLFVLKSQDKRLKLKDHSMYKYVKDIAEA